MRGEVDLDGARDIGILVVVDAAGRAGDADIVDQHVEPAEAVRDRLQHLPRGARIGGLGAGRADPGQRRCGGIEGGGVDVGDMDPRAGRVETGGDFAPDAAGPRRHQDPEVADIDDPRLTGWLHIPSRGHLFRWPSRRQLPTVAGNNSMCVSHVRSEA